MNNHMKSGELEKETKTSVKILILYGTTTGTSKTFSEVG